MGYFASLIVISTAATFACLLVPDGESPSGRLLRLASSLCVLAVALSPIVTAKERVGELFDSFREYANSLSEDSGGCDTDTAIGQELSRQITCAVCEKFGLSGDQVRTAVTLDTSDISSPKLTHVRVSITRGDTAPDPQEVSAYVSEITGAKAETVILAPGTS